MIRAHLSWTQLEPLPQQGLVRTTGTLIWEVEPIEEQVGYTVLIPGNFYSDGASVPAWAWPSLQCTPLQLLVPGIVHDYTVRRDARLIELRQGVSRLIHGTDEAVHIMDNVMDWVGISSNDRWQIRSALNLGPVINGYWRKKDVAWRPDGLR